ncbi:MAG TPA: outer membrane lipoprotein chaperone LolA [Pseudomonadales bacterium]
MAAVKSWFRSAIRAAAPLLLALTAPLGAAAGDADALAARLQSIDNFAATFRQAIADGRGRILEESTGYVLLRRPEFRWVVDAPYPQVIVAGGEDLKIYDPDLAQLTVKPLADALADTPISLLTRNRVALDSEFLVTRLAAELQAAEGAAAAVESFAVRPRSEDSLFAEIRLTFLADRLASLGILDHLGQYTEIRFEADPQRVIQSADFELEVPPGTDVIDG